MSIENIIETAGLSESEIQEKMNDRNPLNEDIVPTDDILISPLPSDD